MKEQEWMTEFSEFVQTEPKDVPADLSSKLQEKMKPLLNPSAFNVFGKVIGIHLGVGLISLAFCHQFGLNPFQTDFSMDAWFMKVGGHHFCMVACGFLFIALGLLAANFWLTIEELKVLKKNGLLQTATLSLISLALIHFFGGEVMLGMGALWLLGAIAAGLVTNQVSWKLRTN